VDTGLDILEKTPLGLVRLGQVHYRLVDLAAFAVRPTHLLHQTRIDPPRLVCKGKKNNKVNFI
jgi:hypothetical protein